MWPAAAMMTAYRVDCWNCRFDVRPVGLRANAGGGVPSSAIAALQALRTVCSIAAGGRRGWARTIECSCFGSSKGLSRPESGRGPCRRQRQLRPDRRSGTQQFDLFRYEERRRRGNDAGLADAASTNAPGSDGAADAPHLNHAAGDHRRQPKKARHDV